MKLLEQTLQEAVETYGSTHPKCAALYNKSGNAFFREGNLRQAKECYQNAVCCDPCQCTASAYLNLGTVYWRMSETDKAKQMLEQALACHELDLLSEGTRSLHTSTFAASAYHQIGLCHALENEFDRALTFLKKALAIRQRLRATVEEGKTLSAMAKVMTMKGDKQKAVAYHEQSFKILASRQALSAKNLSNMANAYEEIGEYGKALAVYKELRTLQERDASDTAATEQKVKQLIEYEEKQQGLGKLIHEASSLNILGPSPLPAVM